MGACMNKRGQPCYNWFEEIQVMQSAIEDLEVAGYSVDTLFENLEKCRYAAVRYRTDAQSDPYYFRLFMDNHESFWDEYEKLKYVPGW